MAKIAPYIGFGMILLGGYLVSFTTLKNEGGLLIVLGAFFSALPFLSKK